MTDTRRLTPEEIAELRRIAEAATPGEWTHGKYGTVNGGPVIEFARGRRQQQIAMAIGQEWQQRGEQEANSVHIAAFNPATALRLIDRLVEVERERDEAYAIGAADCRGTLDRLDTLARDLDAARIACRIAEGRLSEVERERDEALMLAEHPDISTLKDLAREVVYRGQRMLEAESALAQMREELETERLRLSACGVAAMSNTSGAIARQTLPLDSPYRSASYDDVCRAVGREIVHRERAERAEAWLMQVRDVETWVQGEIADANQHLQEYELGSSAPGAQQTRGELRMLRRFAIKLSTALAAEAPTATSSRPVLTRAEAEARLRTALPEAWPLLKLRKRIIARESEGAVDFMPADDAAVEFLLAALFGD